MFELHKPEKTPVVLIRAASGFELSAADRRKLDSIEENAQENTIEAISLNGDLLQINHETKEVAITLNDLALPGNKITPDDFSDEHTFIFSCE